jgi:hypothetical protein
MFIDLLSPTLLHHYARICEHSSSPLTLDFNSSYSSVLLNPNFTLRLSFVSTVYYRQPSFIITLLFVNLHLCYHPLSTTITLRCCPSLMHIFITLHFRQPSIITIVRSPSLCLHSSMYILITIHYRHASPFRFNIDNLPSLLLFTLHHIFITVHYQQPSFMLHLTYTFITIHCQHLSSSITLCHYRCILTLITLMPIFITIHYTRLPTLITLVFINLLSPTLLHHYAHVREHSSSLVFIMIHYF